MQIDFPKLCTIAYANKIIENCLKAKKGTKPLIFHFDRTTWIDAFAITVIAGTIHCCLKTKKREIRYVPPEDEKLKDYLDQIGFNSFFHIDGKDIHKDTSVELTHLNALKPLYIEELIF